jgi:DNA-binding response OmpR family regulator
VSATLHSPEVLLGSDDTQLDGLGKAFIEHGFRMVYRRDVRSLLSHALDGRPSFVMLDASLLDGTAVEVISRIRLHTRVPVVVLIAQVDRATGLASLEAGADDYWVKPLDPDEVITRVRALLRRSGLQPATPRGGMTVSGVTVEPALRRVSIDGRALDVTSLEYELLHYLVRGAGRIVSRYELMTMLLQREPSPLDRSLDVHISRLRKKLGDRRQLIQTVRGAGYIFSPIPA